MSLLRKVEGRIRSGDWVVIQRLERDYNLSAPKDCFFYALDEAHWCANGRMTLTVAKYHSSKPMDGLYMAKPTHIAHFDLRGSFPFNLVMGKADGYGPDYYTYGFLGDPMVGIISGPPPKTEYEARKFLRNVIRTYHKRLANDLHTEWYQNYRDWEDR